MGRGTTFPCPQAIAVAPSLKYPLRRHTCRHHVWRLRCYATDATMVVLRRLDMHGDIGSANRCANGRFRRIRKFVRGRHG
jgi:hypothetical protein